jgi:hypothetical protein
LLDEPVGECPLMRGSSFAGKILFFAKNDSLLLKTVEGFLSYLSNALLKGISSLLIPPFRL